MCCGRDKIWYHCKSETKFIDDFTKSKTFSAQRPFTYAGNKLYLHKKRKSILIINIYHNLGTVLRRGQFLSPNGTFDIDRIKYDNICKLKKLKINKS